MHSQPTGAHNLQNTTSVSSALSAHNGASDGMLQPLSGSLAPSPAQPHPGVCAAEQQVSDDQTSACGNCPGSHARGHGRKVCGDDNKGSLDSSGRDITRAGAGGTSAGAGEEDDSIYGLDSHGGLSNAFRGRGRRSDGCSNRGRKAHHEGGSNDRGQHQSYQQPASQQQQQHNGTAAYSDGRGGSAGVVGCSASGGVGSTTAEGGSGGSLPQPRGFVAANHLLNFQYESSRGRGARSVRTARGAGRSRGGTMAGRRWAPGPPRPQRYDRNKFLQANFRFLVSDAVDVAQFVADADKMFDWDDVVQVEMRSTEVLQCPISLDSPPFCPQITPCGHVYSFNAIMQHLIHHGGESLRRSAPCPLCYAPIVARDLRLARIRGVEAAPTSGGDGMMSMTLLKRPKGSILPQPIAAAGLGNMSGTKPPSGAAGTLVLPASLDANHFVKFAVVSDAAPLWHDTAGELASHAAQVLAEGGAEAAAEAPSIYAALDALALRAKRWTTNRAEHLEHQQVMHSAARPAASADGGRVPPEVRGVLAEAQIKKVFNAIVTAKTEALQPAASRHVSPPAPSEPFPGLPSRSTLPPGPATASTHTTVSLASWRDVPFTHVAAPAVCACLHSKASVMTGTAPHTAVGDGNTGTELPGPTSARAMTSLHVTARAAVPMSKSCAHATATSSKAGGAAYNHPPAANNAGTAGGGGNDSGGWDKQESTPSGLQAMSHQEDEELEMQCGAFEPAFSDEEEGGDSGGSAADHGSSGTWTALGAGAALRPTSEIGLCSSAPGAADGESRGDGCSGAVPDALLGTSPNMAKLNAPNTSGDFFWYQASDGQWIFLDPLNVRCLLNYYGAYECCPPSIKAPVVETELVVQCDATRRRWRFLGHLPLGGNFRLMELDLTYVLPPDALAPFAEELQQREKHRRRRAADERRAAAAEAAAVAAAAAAKRGPTASELLAMPDLSGRTTQAELEEALALQAICDEAAVEAAPAGSLSAASPPPGGVSFARMTRMGYAATGPALGGATPAAGLRPVPGSSPLPTSSPPGPAGAWLARSGTAAPGAQLPAAAAAACGAAVPRTTSGSGWGTTATARAGAAAPVAGGGVIEGGDAGSTSAKKGKKGVLLFSTAQRRH